MLLARTSSTPPGDRNRRAWRNGQFAHNKRINVNADYGIEAELSKNFSVSDAF